MATKKVPVSDKKSIVKYKELCSEKYGRYLVAAKKINAGEVIMRDKPVAGLGTQVIDDNHLCFACLKIIPTCADIARSITLCKICKVAVFCSVACQAKKSYHTIEECKILKNKKLSFNVKDILLPLRLWLIKKQDEKLWEKVLRLNAHLEERRGTPAWKSCEKYVINPLKSLGIVDKSEENQFSELIQRICGILDVNSFGAQPPGSPADFMLRGLYLEASLIAHDCRGNSFSTMDDKYVMTVYASKPINEGEMILCNYIAPLLGTADRQKHLREEKYFECDCPQCEDPYELGTNLSTIFCPYCNDGLITLAKGKTKYPYVKEKNWKCNKCQVSLSGYLIAFYLHLVKLRIKQSENSCKKLEVLLKKLSSIFHPNHFLMLDIKRKVSQLYKIEGMCSEPTKEKLKRILEIDTAIVNILEIVMPGISCYKGPFFYNLYDTTLYLANRGHSTGEITSVEYVKQREEAIKYLDRTLKMLMYASPNTPNGIIFKRALHEYKALCPGKTFTK